MQVQYSTYHLKNKPSGLCNHQLYVDMNAWNDDIQDALSETDLLTTSFEEIEDKLPPLALPGFMSFPESAKDVSEIVKFANDNGVKVSVKNSGHSFTGGSSSKGSVQINLRKYPQYSFTDIYECNEGREYTPLSGPDGACKLALARGKTAAVRVGGGQGNDDMYRSVMDYNYMEPRTKRYNVVGGMEGMVGSGGGWMMGGGLGRGEERLYGSGADQVLELEMILPDGQHVKFGPTEWEMKDGFEYPQTTKVEGMCNANVHHDETEWKWVECEGGQPFANVTFADLWFAVRGGGGGAWGVVLSAMHNLHELLPQYQVQAVQVDPSEDILNKTCTKLEGDPECPQYKDMMDKMWKDFLIDLLWNEDNDIGVDQELSRHCGFTGVATHNPITSGYNTLKCHGHGIQEKFSQAWQTSVSKSKYILVGYGEEELCAIKSRIFMEGGTYDKWHRDRTGANSVDRSYSAVDGGTRRPFVSYTPIGKYTDVSGLKGAFSSGFDASVPSTMIPASLLATKSEEVMSLSFFVVGVTTHTLPYASQNDGMTPMAKAYHSGGIETHFVPYKAIYAAWVNGEFDLQNPCSVSEAILSAYEKETGEYQAWILPHLGYEEGGDFPGFVERNHIFLYYGGVLKSDPTKPCPFMSTAEEKKELCLTAQETVYGSANFRRLTAIKNAIDPNNVFDVHFGIGNDERPGPFSDYCAKPTDPTVPPLTGWDSTEQRADEPLDCKTVPPAANDSAASDDNDEAGQTNGGTLKLVAGFVSVSVSTAVVFVTM